MNPLNELMTSENGLPFLAENMGTALVAIRQLTLDREVELDISKASPEAKDALVQEVVVLRKFLYPILGIAAVASRLLADFLESHDWLDMEDVESWLRELILFSSCRCAPELRRTEPWAVHRLMTVLYGLCDEVGKYPEVEGDPRWKEPLFTLAALEKAYTAWSPPKDELYEKLIWTLLRNKFPIVL